MTKSTTTCRWREQQGVIYLSVVSEGWTGSEWEKWCDEKRHLLSPSARFILNSADFKQTTGVKYEVAILKGTLFKNEDRISKKIHAEANRRKLLKPNAEVTCLIRKNFADSEIEAMGLMSIVVMHEPIRNSSGDPCLFYTGRNTDARSLSSYNDWPNCYYGLNHGFAFVISQSDAAQSAL